MQHSTSFSRTWPFSFSKKKGRKKCQIRQILFFALLLCAHMAVASRVEVSQYDASSSRSIHRKSAIKRGRENNPPTLLFPLRFVVGTKRTPGFRKWRDMLFPFSRIRPPFLFLLHPEKRKSQGCQRCDEIAFSIFSTARHFFPIASAVALFTVFKGFLQYFEQGCRNLPTAGL